MSEGAHEPVRAGLPPAGWDCHVHVFDDQEPARAGHYQPAHHPIADIETLAAAHGVGHLVLVQPSVYGSNNHLLLQALQQQPGRHRGVLVLNAQGGLGEGARLDSAALVNLHAQGVRGVRLNAVSPVGVAAGAAAGSASAFSAQFECLAPLLRAQGWHLQWYAQPEHLPAIAALHAHSGGVAVLDHLAGLYAGVADDHPAWAALRVLAEQGAWLKLSGWYRLRAAEPYAEVLPIVQRVAPWFGSRLVWGSDWPHTLFEAGSLPRYASTWQPVVKALGAARAAVVHAAAAELYR